MNVINKLSNKTVFSGSYEQCEQFINHVEWLKKETNIALVDNFGKFMDWLENLEIV